MNHTRNEKSILLTIQQRHLIITIRVTSFDQDKKDERACIQIY